MLRRRVEFAFERTLCERERQKLTSLFTFPVLHVVLNKRCQRQTGVFTVLHLCRVLLRDAVRCSARKPRNNLKVTMPITNVMVVRHFVSRSRLIAPKSLATV